jgi:signal peptidase I
VLIFVVAGMTQTWLIDGLVIPYRVAGSSMAGTLLGVHRDVVCGDCGCPFFCGTDRLPAARRAVCPNCGSAANDLESLPDVGGDYVLIDRAAFSIRPPRRWEVVAFRRLSQADQIVVKRIVGLPGEAIEIRHGDVHADGRLLRKNLAQQRALAILVHDADFQSRHEPATLPRWRAERSDSRWNTVGGGFVHAAGPDKESIDWLVYHHSHQSPVTDLCGYNPSQPRREEDVHPVADLILSFRVRLVSGRGSFRVRTGDGRDSFEAQFTLDGGQQSYRIFRNQRPLAGATGKILPASGNRLVEVSLVDQQFLLALDGQTLWAGAYERAEPPPIPPTCPWAIGVQGLQVAVGGLRVCRDVYYTEPQGASGRRRSERPMHLEAGQYYVLGDNSPVSEDSRQWQEAGEVDAKLLVGKPLVAVAPARPLLERWWHFQVPNPAQIRYIW